MTREQLLNNISSIELTEWFIYFKDELFPDDRIDLAIGNVTAAIINQQRRNKNDKIYSPYDFMWNNNKHKNKNQQIQSIEDQLRIAKSLVHIANIKTMKGG